MQCLLTIQKVLALTLNLIGNLFEVDGGRIRVQTGGGGEGGVGPGLENVWKVDSVQA
jgi:hypothetical protein